MAQTTCAKVRWSKSSRHAWQGFHIKIYDQYVSIASLVGSNKEYIDKEIPHISSLMCSTATEVIQESEVIVVSSRSEEFPEALQNGVREHQIVVDLVRIIEDPTMLKGGYYGICW